MSRVLLWVTLGYASCVWDCSINPVDARWPSATAVFLLLLAMRVPQHSQWGAGLCGLVLDAAQGGPLGLRVLAGVVLTAFACRMGIGRQGTKWPRMTLLVVLVSAGWLAIPQLVTWGLSVTTTLGNAEVYQALAYRTVSTTLVTLAIWSLIRIGTPPVDDR